MVDNQHKKIKGYRDLSQEEIDLMNQLKEKSEEVGQLIEKLQITPSLDQRWISIGCTQLQQGFMATIRGDSQTNNVLKIRASLPSRGCGEIRGGEPSGEPPAYF